MSVTKQAVKEFFWSTRLRVYERTGKFARLRRRQAGGLRILTYHGVCRDDELGRPWMPHYFVTEGLLDQHLTWLKESGEIVSLEEGWVVLNQARSRDRLLFAITFDDGHYNNLALAQPILATHQAPATVFLTTGFMKHGGQVPPWIKGRWLRHLVSTEQFRIHEPAQLEAIDAACRWGSISIYDLIPKIEPIWEHARPLLDPEGIERTRCMTPGEARQLQHRGITLGAHTVHHPFLSRVDDDCRRRELAQSVAHVRELTSHSFVPFAYPNGKPTDFGDIDIQVLRRLNVPLAVTTVPGINKPSSKLDMYRLHRLPVSRCKIRNDFLAMVSGLYDHDRLWRSPD